MEDNKLQFAYRTSNGVYLKRGFNQESNDVMSKKLDASTNLCRVMTFSNNGTMLGYCDLKNLVCIDTSTGAELFSYPFPKVSKIMFSPDDRLIVTWEPYVIYGLRKDEHGNDRKPDPNLRFFDCETKQFLTALIWKNQTDWQPLFTADGQTFVLKDESHISFYSSEKPDNCKRKREHEGIKKLSISPAPDSTFASFALVNDKPGMISLHKFLDFSLISQIEVKDVTKCDFLWNSRGDACLATIEIKVEEALQNHYYTSQVILLSKKHKPIYAPLNKRGPINVVQWSPTDTQFAISYGSIPSIVSVFNLRASKIWCLGELQATIICYNQFGNILATCGEKDVCFWDTLERKKIASLEIERANHFEWAPDGQHFMTASLAPDYRFNNNFKVWNMYGKKIYEQDMIEKVDEKNFKKIELAQISFQPSPDTYPPFIINQMAYANGKLKSVEKKLSSGEIKKDQSNRLDVTPKSNSSMNDDLQSESTQDNYSETKKPLSDEQRTLNILEVKLTEIENLKMRVENGEILERIDLLKLNKFDELSQHWSKISPVGSL